ncbi:MAG: hypothetical protein ACM3QW_06325 [Ignavibacteriales bacterium]
MQRTRGIIFMFAFCLAGGIFFNSQVLLRGQDSVITKVRYPAMECSLRKDELSRLNRTWRWSRLSSAVKPEKSPDYILITSADRILIWRTPGIMFLVKDNRCVTLTPDICRSLDLPIARLETDIAEKYGELMPWKEVQKCFPRFATAEITDCRTGLKFHVQRRAGSYHADCQPLTREDTAIMKQACGNRWSWERRAVIVSTGGYRIAASMAGQPHGHGAIPNNGFPGHFCIHFWKSRVHASGQIDARHQRQILNAYGSI